MNSLMQESVSLRSTSQSDKLVKTHVDGGEAGPPEAIYYLQVACKVVRVALWN